MSTTISVTLEQTNEIIQDATDGSLTYRVTCKIVATEGLPLTLFVFDVLRQLFNHVATPYDIVTYPASLSDALSQGVDFYRLSETVREFTSLDQAVDFARVTRARLRTLVADTPSTLETFEGTQTYTYTS